ncbi:4-hydroxy-tetrahydrodipicolinate synthase [Flavobacteriaceae bacterium]|nr:4-hydroxy-tetrahydrodipicolinate synthase [Flavobacteriaceae bacterium]
MTELFGTGVALVTPFDAAGKVDFDALTSLVNYQIENGVNYLVVLGTTGEPATMNSEERNAVVKHIVKINNRRLPLVMGVGGNNTLEVCEAVKQVSTEYFCAILSVSPYYNKPTQEGIYRHFMAVADSSPLPIILYNVPGRTGSNMSPDTVLRLSQDADNIIGLKEAAGDLAQALEIIRLVPKDFLVISGDDMIALGMTLAGGAGVISVIGQGLPKEFSALIRLGLEGFAKPAYELHFKVMPSIDLIFEEGNPAGIKSLLNQLGIGTKTVRLPLVEASEDLENRIALFLKKIK